MRHRSLTESASPASVAVPSSWPIPPERTEYVRDLLLHFARLGWPGAPRFEGIDTDGHLLTSTPAGHIASHPVQPPAVWSTTALVRVARLVRQLHDLTAGTRLAGDLDVVCHHALAPRTTVYRRPDLVPFAFVGWEQAAPGHRLDDLAHVCWQFLGLGPDRSSAYAVGGLMRQVSDAYGLTGRERGQLVEAILDRVDDETADWIEAERTGLETGLG